MFRYIEPNRIMTNKVKAIEALLSEYIYPHAKKMNGDMFRRYYCYNVKTNELLGKNEIQLKKLYDSFTHVKKKYITLDELKGYVRKLGLNISEIFVGAIYAECMMTI